MKTAARLYKFAFALIPVCALAIGFQNCTKPEKRDSTAAQKSEMSGNGAGYEGKIYVHDNPAGVCADGSRYDASIAVYPDMAKSLRDNCADHDPAVLPNGSVQVAPDEKSLVYQGETYNLTGDAAPLSSGPKPGCPAGRACVAWVNYYLGDGIQYLSDVTVGNCVPVEDGKYRIYSFVADYQDILVDLPYSAGPGCPFGGGSQNCYTEAELRPLNQCSY